VLAFHERRHLKAQAFPRHMSCVLCHVQVLCVMPHAHVSVCHMSYVMCHVSGVMYYVAYVMRHVSCVMCRVPYVVCHYAICHGLYVMFRCVICHVPYVMFHHRHVRCVMCVVCRSLSVLSFCCIVNVGCRIVIDNVINFGMC
jgi:hypothetical protein